MYKIIDPNDKEVKWIAKNGIEAFMAQCLGWKIEKIENGEKNNG